MPKKAKSSKKTLIFLSLFIITIVVASMLLFRPVETPKSDYEIIVGEGSEKAVVKISLQPSYVLSLTSYRAEWQDASGNTITQITWSVTVTLSSVSNMEYDSGQTSYVKIKVSGASKTKIYQINLSWQTSTKATGSLTKNIDTFLSEIGVTIDEGESVTFNNYLYEAKIYLKGTISGNGYTASIGEQTSSFGSFTIKKPLPPPSISTITLSDYYYKYKDTDGNYFYFGSGKGTDITHLLTDGSDDKYCYAFSTGTSVTVRLEVKITGTGSWSNVRIGARIFVGGYDNGYKNIYPVSVSWQLKDTSDNVLASGTWSVPDVGFRTFYTSYLNLDSYKSSGVKLWMKYTESYSSTLEFRLFLSEIYVERQTASFIDFSAFFTRTDIQVALIVAVIFVLAIFVKKRKKVKRYARRH